jgi:hypothetical protein
VPRSYAYVYTHTRYNIYIYNIIYNIIEYVIL